MLNPLIYYRLARWCHLHRISLLPRVIQRLSILVFHCYIPYTVEVGEGFELGYWGLGVVIHPNVKIGRNVFVAQCVTIGGRSQATGVPTIEDNVFIAAGAKILGDIVVGEGSVVGANAVVIRSVPPRSIVGGVPARIIRQNINVRDYTGWPDKPLPPKNRIAPDIDRATDRVTRVFYLVESFNLGGTEHQAAEVARRMNSQQYRVTVGCLSQSGPFLELVREAGIPVVEFHPGGALLGLRGVYQLARLAWFLRRGKFNVVHTHDLYSTLLGVPAAWLARVPLIVSSRRDLGRWWWYTPQNKRFLKFIQHLGTVVVANSAAVRDYLVKQEGYGPEFVKIIGNGIDVEPFLTASPSPEKFFPNLTDKSKLIAVVANMNVETKGHADLIEAASIVCRTHAESGFLLVGDGRERPRLEKKVDELELRGRISFLGYRQDIPNLLRCCALSVLPSWAEGLPNVVLESMAAGVPVVATRVGGTEEIIEDGIHGLLVPPHEPRALAQSILRILQDGELAQKLATAGQERVRACFSFERTLSELRRLYELDLQPGFSAPRKGRRRKWRQADRVPSSIKQVEFPEP
jgi:glycosyltransferase involved in cell wall biosynthesis/serine acetyltransferase